MLEVKAVNILCVFWKKNNDGMQTASYLFGKIKDFYLWDFCEKQSWSNLSD